MRLLPTMSICDTPSFVTKEKCLFHSPAGREGQNQLCEILLTLFEYISQKSISVSRGTLSQPCQKNKSSGCVLNQTYYFTCNITFIIVGFFLLCYCNHSFLWQRAMRVLLSFSHSLRSFVQSVRVGFITPVKNNNYYLYKK